jgi:hypothetical protein
MLLSRRQSNTNNTTMTNEYTIRPASTLTARSACDHNCVFTANVLTRSAKSVTVEVDGKIKRCKIHAGHDGVEFIYALGQYSMAPIFRAA